MTDGTELRHPRRRERGQVLPLALVPLAVAAAVGLGLVHLGRAAVDDARAQAAADAAALAGAVHGEAVAAEVAEENGAELVRYDREGDEVQVTVAAGSASQRARARWIPAPIP